MDTLTISLRLLHILFGVFWVGASLFLSFVLEPKLRALGPPVQGPVMRVLMPVITPAFTISSVVILVTGAVLALRLSSLGDMLATDWGWAMLVGLVATLAATVLGLGFTSVAGKRMATLGQSMEGRRPTPEEAQQLGSLSQRLRTLSRVTTALLVLAVVSMAAARYL